MNTNEMILKTIKCGESRDNMLFENCPFNIMLTAGQNLCKAQNGCMPINITLNVAIEKKLEKLFLACNNEMQRVIFAECYVNSLIMFQIMKKFSILETRFGSTLGYIEKGLKILETGNFEDAKKYYSNAPSFFEISVTLKRLSKIELNVFLFNTKNKYLQYAINKYLGCRETYSVKVLTNSKLPVYCLHDGQFIQSPHDYILYDLNRGLEKTFN